MTGELESEALPTEEEAPPMEGEALPTDDESSSTEGEARPTEDEAPPAVVSRTVLIVSVLAALLVAGVAGMAIGWKVEQQRVKDDLANIRPVGTVTAVSDSSMSVDLLTAEGTRTYVITDKTVVEDGSNSGDVSDVTEGSIVLVRSRHDGDKLQAIEIVVLPDSTTFGGH